MLVNVALAGERAGSGAHRHLFISRFLFSFLFLSFVFFEKARSNIIDRPSLSFSALFYWFHVLMKTDSEQAGE